MEASDVRIEQEPQVKKKVAVIGGASTRNAAPFNDLTWDIWAFSSLRSHTPRITRWFEMHALEDLQEQLLEDTPRRLSYRNYLRFLQELACPVYMQREYEEIPYSVEYPLQAALAAFGKCFSSTAAYLLALAILEGYHVIGVWGIHLTEKTVYARQRPGVEYLLGMARQRGIQVCLPKRSPLRIPARPTLPETAILYGYDWQTSQAWWRTKRHKNRRSDVGDQKRVKT
ncbi:MAG: hypothetical protein ACOX44_02200 [Limnochordia bacterium]